MRLLFALLMIAGLAACSNAQSTDEAFKDVTVSEAKQLLADQPEILVLDVRTDEECAQGMIAEAMQMNISANDFQSNLETLDKSKTYLVYCKAGGRSSRAQAMMQKMGFEHVYNLEGGYTAWAQ